MDTARDGQTPCTSGECDAVREQVNKVCKANEWPVGHHVLVCNPDGHCCYCECYKSNPREGEAATELEDCPPELAAKVQDYINRACAEAGTDTIAVVFTDGGTYQCHKR